MYRWPPCLSSCTGCCSRLLSNTRGVVCPTLLVCKYGRRYPGRVTECGRVRDPARDRPGSMRGKYPAPRPAGLPRGGGIACPFPARPGPGGTAGQGVFRVKRPYFADSVKISGYFPGSGKPCGSLRNLRQGTYGRYGENPPVTGPVPGSETLVQVSVLRIEFLKSISPKNSGWPGG